MVSAVSTLEVTTSERKGIAQLALTGDLDLSTAGQLEEELGGVERSGASTIVLDLRGLEFIDSTALRVVVGADSRARAEGRRLFLVRGQENVERVFRITGLDSRLEFVDEPSSLPAG